MSNLWDELFHILVSGIVKESDGAAWQYDAIEAAAILEGLMPTIDRAIAAERAATIEECAAIGDRWAVQNRAHKVYDEILQAAEYEATAYAAEIRNLPRNHSALDDALAQARREQREKDAAIARPVDEVLADVIVAQEDKP